jgi:hypothetical protein
MEAVSPAVKRPAQIKPLLQAQPEDYLWEVAILNKCDIVQ